jgi:hypothetical protein
MEIGRCGSIEGSVPPAEHRRLIAQLKDIIVHLVVYVFPGSSLTTCGKVASLVGTVKVSLQVSTASYLACSSSCGLLLSQVVHDVGAEHLCAGHPVQGCQEGLPRQLHGGRGE